jgi:hypothetical protein
MFRRSLHCAVTGYFQSGNRMEIFTRFIRRSRVCMVGTTTPAIGIAFFIKFFPQGKVNAIK